MSDERRLTDEEMREVLDRQPAVLAMHTEANTGFYADQGMCRVCGTRWPCATVRDARALLQLAAPSDTSEGQGDFTRMIEAMDDFELDSPNFTPAMIATLAARGYKRVNRRAPDNASAAPEGPCPGCDPSFSCFDGGALCRKDWIPPEPAPTSEAGGEERK